MLVWLTNNADAIVAGIVASLLAVSLQTVSRAFSELIASALTSRLFLRKLFSINKKNNVYIISGSVPQRRDKDLALLMGPDASAAINIKQTIENIYSTLTVRHNYSKLGSLGIADVNIISVGGPVFNHTTKMLMRQLEGQLYFDESDALHFNGEKFEKCKKSLVDYGFIVRFPNPVSPQHKAFIVAGCGSNGVLAASQLINKTNRFSWLKAEFKRKFGFLNRLRNKDYIVIFRTTIIENDVGDVHIVDVKPFEEMK